MKKLIQIEWIKIKKLTSVKVILAIYMALIPLALLGMNEFFEKINKELHLFPNSETMFSFPNIWNLITYTGSYFNLLLAVVVIILATNEFSNRTLRQHIIDGLTKRQVIASKFIVIFFLSAVATAYVFLVGTIFGLAQGKGLDWYTNVHFVGLFFIQTLCYFGLAFLLSVLLTRPAVTIVLFYGVLFVEVVISMFLPKSVYAFMPMNNISKLTPLPYFREIFVEHQDPKHPREFYILDMWQVAVLSLLFMGLFYAIALFRLNRKDL
jgi:ABC-type transport system involved in multi-copper enzyme maturation permease subunit